MLSCQEPDSNPYSFGSLSSHFRTVLRRDLGSLPLLPIRLLLNRPFNPRLLIRKEFGVTVRARTLRRWLRRIGFSWRKDRYVPYRSVSKEGQEEFKREVGERASQRRADGMAVFAEDEAAVPEPRLRVEADRGGGRAGQGKLLKGVCQDIRRDVPRRAANKDRGVDELGDVPGIPGGDPQGSSAVIHGP